MSHDIWRIGTRWDDDKLYYLFKKYGVAFVGFADLDEGPEEGAWSRLLYAHKNNTFVLLAVAEGFKIHAVAKIIRCYDTLGEFMEERGISDPNLKVYDGESTRACAVDFYELPKHKHVKYAAQLRLCQINKESVRTQVYKQYMKLAEGRG